MERGESGSGRLTMTYNFDPDKWYQNERAVILSRHAAGEMTQPEYENAMAELQEKYEDMWKRLDGSYRI